MGAHQAGGRCRALGYGRRGYSLLEVTTSTLIVGVMLVAAMNTVGTSARSQRSNSDEGRGSLLASDLMTEILTLPYTDPSGSGVMGPETGETTGGTRTAFDDVDDYHNWTATPPQDKQGTAIPNTAGWTQSVQVVLVNPNDLTSTSYGSLVPVKRITVTVSKSSRIIERLTAAVSSD